jgi:6-bladed beta-propeller
MRNIMMTIPLLLVLIIVSLADTEVSILKRATYFIAQNKRDIETETKANDKYIINCIKDLEIVSRNNEISNVRNIAVDKDGNIYISDTKMFHIRVFDKNGGYKYDIGNRGQGPGEFIYIAEMHIINDTHIFTFDPGNHRISQFSLEGKLNKEINVGKEATLIRATEDYDGNYIGIKSVYENNDYQELKKFNDKMDFLYNIAIVESHKTNKGEYEYFPASIRFALYKNLVIWASVFDNKLYFINNNNEKEKTIIFKAKDVTIDRDDKKKLTYDYFTADHMPAPQNPIYPKSFPKIDHFGVSDDGIIFLCNYERNGKAKYSYYFIDINGKFNIHEFLDFRISYWKNNKIYSIEEDKDGFPIVTRYKVSIEKNNKK